MTMSPGVQELAHALQRRFPDRAVDVTIGDNHRFMVHLCTPNSVFVIEHLDGSYGISRVRDLADSFLAGHEIVLESPTEELLMNTLTQFVSAEK